MKEENACVMTCALCKYESRRLGSHISQYHKMLPKEYYDLHMKKENDGKCEICNEKSKFYGIRYGYSRTCGNPHCVATLGSKKLGFSERSSARMKNFWSDPVRKRKTVAKMTKSIQAKWDNDPVYRAKCSESSRKKWQNNEYRKKTCESQSVGASRRIAEIGNGHSDRNYKTGEYFSVKTNKSLYYASSYEHMAFEKLENDNDVFSYNRAKIAIKYVRPDDHRFHRYVPDILAEMKDGSKMLIEIKPTSMLEDEIIKAKIVAAQLYCDKKNYRYAVWSEKDLHNVTQ